MDAQVFAPGQGVGFRIPQNMPKDWFSYPLQYTDVADGDNLTQTIQIDAGSDFYLTALTFFATIDSATAGVTVSTTPVPAVTLLINDSGSNRNLSNAAVPLSLIAGDGNHPHRLIHPRLFVRNSAIQVLLRSFDPTTYDNLWVNLEGFRIYGT